ncbi:MAG: alpha-D-ribose 1-methylphosphonate 5-triphosphate diphosphatase [Nitrospirae bacterium]|nr:alpha-D-ribose 1-methylphosphonate 5-triphosphate diphosphatase [Nitrospirota bacterium]
MQHSNGLIIENARIATPAGTLGRSSLKVEAGIISKIKEGEIRSAGRRIDADGRYIIPGFIDLHSDAIEKEIEPRPNTFFPKDVAIFELDKKLAAYGVTTIFHALSFAEGEIGVRSNGMAADIIREVGRLAPKLGVKTRIHARFEITDTGAVPYLEVLLNGGQIHLLSFMDHTPGQGQYKDVASFKNYFGRVYKKSDEELDRMIDRKLTAKKDSRSCVQHVIDLCASLGVPMASHDDDTPERIRWLREKSIGISEFPVNREALKTAKEMDIFTCLGAPNVFRGNSQVGNLSARDALSEGYGDIICSDYSPMTILHALFAIVNTGILPLHEAVNMVSLNPASAVGINGRTGSIEEGKEADLAIVDVADGIPRILRTYVSGKEVFSACGC